MLNLCTLDDFNKRRKHYTCLIYGESGVGKTTFASSASNPILIDCEDGFSRMQAKDFLKCPTVCISKFSELQQITLQDVEPYDTIILDTFGGLVRLCMKSFTCTTPTRKQWGQVYNQVMFALDKFIGRKNIIATAHVDDVDIGGQENSVKRLVPQAQGSSIDSFITRCDLVGYMYRSSNGQRVINFNGNDITTGKNSRNLPILNIPDTSNTTNETFKELVERKIQAFLITEERSQEEWKIKKEKYNQLWETIKAKIDAAQTPEQFTMIRNEYSQYEDVYNVRERAREYLNNKNRQPEFGFKFDVERNCFYKEDL